MPEPQATDPTTRWRKVEALFHRALELPAGERDGMLRVWCQEDPTLLTEVLELLHADSAVEQKFQRGVSSTGSGDPAPDSLLLEPGFEPRRNDSWLGRTLGHYRVARELGRGGMGVVYLGERAGTTAAPGPHPQAAIKVVRRNLQDSPAVGHFLLERDALARLEHPNIARLLDGGVTPEGVPFLIMEYIEGRRLDVVCDDPMLSVESMCRLMIQLCAAVGYVHRNLILHRDLKPGNVMVSNEGVLKLLDFGTLKLLEPSVAGKPALFTLPSEMTQAGMRPITLRFASPEHIRGERVSTASDVYSMGIMLYRLISGRFPEAAPKAPGTPTTPTRPGVGGYLEDLERSRIEPPSKFATRPIRPELARDLDAITLKAMRFEPGARYSSAEALAADLGRALEDRPVEARGADKRYRARKFYGRHKLALWAGVAAAVILAAGIAGMVRETKAARAEQARAEAAVDQERKLAHLLLFDYFTHLQEIPGSTEAQRKAVTEAVRYLDGLTATAPSPAVTLETVRAYTSMGALLGSPYYQNLGDIPAAISTLGKALPLAQTLVRQSPADPNYLLALSGVQMTLGQVYMGDSKPKLALENLESARKIALGLVDKDPKYISRATVVLGLLTDVYSQRGEGAMRDPAKATEILQQTQALHFRILAKDPGNPKIVNNVALGYTKLGQLAEPVDAERAMDYYKQGIAELDSLTPAQKKSTFVVRAYSVLQQDIMSVDFYTGHRAEAEAIASSERAVTQEQIAQDPTDTRARADLMDIESTIADGYNGIGDYPAALGAANQYLEAVRYLVQLQPKNAAWHALYVVGLLRDGRYLALSGHPDEGLRQCNTGLDLVIPLATAPDAEPDTLDLAAEFLVFLHRNPAADGPMAVSFARRSIALSGQPSVSQLFNLADAQRLAGDPAGARGTIKSAQALIDSTPKALGHARDLAQAKEKLKSVL